MILQLPFFLDISSDKQVAFKIILLVKKKVPKLSKKLKKKPCISKVKKYPKLDKKTRNENRGFNQ